MIAKYMIIYATNEICDAASRILKYCVLLCIEVVFPMGVILAKLIIVKSWILSVINSFNTIIIHVYWLLFMYAYFFIMCGSVRGVCTSTCSTLLYMLPSCMILWLSPKIRTIMNIHFHFPSSMYISHLHTNFYCFNYKWLQYSFCDLENVIYLFMYIYIIELMYLSLMSKPSKWPLLCFNWR